MKTSVGHFATLAALFTYPDAAYADTVREVQAFLDRTCTGAADELCEFTEFTAGATVIELEELYTRSFDVQAITTLDIGYVIFADDYKRGQLLVNLNAEHREAGVDCGHELADHLPNVLKLLDAMEKPELRNELVQRIVAPALRKIIGEFDPHKIEKKNQVYRKHHRTLIERSRHHGVLYERPLRALFMVLARDFNVSPVDEAPVPHQSQFLNSIGTEIELECSKGHDHVSTE